MYEKLDFCLQIRLPHGVVRLMDEHIASTVGKVGARANRSAFIRQAIRNELNRLEWGE